MISTLAKESKAASKKLDSCSPIPSRPTNPNSRNSEINPMRRSFSGSPFSKPSIISSQRGGGFNPNTPVNSPSDYPRRNSINRDNIVVTLRDHEDKENGKDQTWKSVRIRSPAKGTKNFMSPTISAASKFNASPKIKILADRNEQIRTSISFAEAKSPLMEDLDSNPDSHYRGLNQKEVSFDSTVIYLADNNDSKSEKRVDLMVDSSAKDDLNLSSVEKDCVNLDPSFKISPRVSSSLPSPALAPLDADPSLPPYDPKTNYLSPRPRFLHYRPNPRIELYLNKERDGQPLDEIFASECSSETEVSEAEDSHSDDLHKESDASSANEVIEEAEPEELLPISEPNPIGTFVEEEDEELLVTEPNSISTSVEKAEEKRVSKSHFFTRRKFDALLFVLIVGFLFGLFSKSPVMDPSVLNNLTFPEPYVPPELSEYARQNLEALANKVQLWLHQSICYTHNLINSFRGGHKMGSLQYANLTILVEDGTVDGQFTFDQSILGSKVKYEEKVSEAISAAEVDVKLVDGGDQPSAAEEDIKEVAGDNNNGYIDNVPDPEGVPESEEVNRLPQSEVTEPGKSTQEVIQENAAEDIKEVARGSNNGYIDSVPDSEEVNLVPQSDVTEPGKSIQEVIQENAETAAYVVKLQSNIDLEDQFVLIPQDAEIQPEILNSMQSQSRDDISSADIESSAADDNSEILEGAATENPRSSELVNTHSAQIMIGISLIAFSLLGTVFIYMKSRTPTAQNATFTVDQVPITKKLDCSPLSVAAEHTCIAGESCSSEMSSFSLSYSDKQKGKSEAPSYERKPRKNNHRRESMASSDYSVGSMGSLSYGSFTTFEKIPSKHVKKGNADEEVITPVRRSSRIRHQVTSP
ncbi:TRANSMEMBRANE PROTEIN [Salix purpurea]|uniref:TRANSMEMBRANE PROTEIN n=1 Tax=Salix purpurea TaxID=77065 RepID=A0A9Q0PPX6_SALPP|nr:TRANSMEMBRANE PROTEIN [Salix purpurea]